MFFTQGVLYNYMDSTVLDVCDPTKLTCGENKKETDLFQLHHLSSCTKKKHIPIVFMRKKRWCSITTLHCKRYSTPLPLSNFVWECSRFHITLYLKRTPIYSLCGFLSKPPAIKKLQMLIKLFFILTSTTLLDFLDFCSCRSLAMQGVKIFSNLMGLARRHLVGTEP